MAIETGLPKRIQRRRTSGWRMPDGAVYVGRPTRWGNPWYVGTGQVTVQGFTEGPGAGQYDYHDQRRYEMVVPGSQGVTVEMAVALYRDDLLMNLADADSYFDELREALKALRGRDLCCWCSLDQPCHADVLLEEANR